MTENIQDGFDAIEYPLDFSFKAVCDKQAVDGNDKNKILETIVKSSVSKIVGEQRVKKLNAKESSGGRYVSITITALLENRSELERIYSSLSECSEVKMTL